MQFKKTSFRKQLCLVILAVVFSFNASRAQDKADKETVAIYPFTTSRDYSYDFALGVGNAVEAGVLRSNRFKVVERNRFGSIKEEDRFKEANTSDIVNKAAKLGAKIIVTGHVVGVSRGDLLDFNQRPNGREYVTISLSFKIIDVASTEIKKSETISGRGEGDNYAEAAQNAYMSIDKLVRANIGDYLPQRFKYMSTVSTATKKKGEYLDKFKIWGGSDDGLKVGDIIEIYKIAYIVNPNNNKRVEDKQLLGSANIVEINSGSIATCSVIDGKTAGVAILGLVISSPDNVVLEYKGDWYEKRTWLDLLGK